MKYLKTFLVTLLLLAVAMPQSADAQFKRLRDRAKNRAKERLTQHAEKKVDQVVDKAVDETVARTENKLKAWVKDAFDGNASVSEDGVLSRDGLDDVKLVANESSPSTSDYLNYIEISTIKVPGLASFGGMTTATDYYYYGNRTSMDDASSRTVIDLEGERMVVADHDKKTYWEQTFAETAEMMNLAMERMADEQAGREVYRENVEEPEVEGRMEMNFSLDVDDTGINEMVNGVNASRYVYTMETITTGETEEGTQHVSKFYTVTVALVSTGVAGYESLTAFQRRAGEVVSDQAMSSGLADKMGGLSFLDGRIGDSMKKSAEEMSKVEGLPVKTTTYMVTVPEDKTLDLDKVFSGEMDDAMGSAMAGTEGNDMPQEQRTVLITETYISNLTADRFSADKVGVPDNYKLVESPMVKMVESMDKKKAKKK